MVLLLRKIALATLVVAPLSFVGCDKQPVNSSDTLVTDVAHTTVKRQSIGNCWIYAQATWLESKLLSASGQELDVSESYWTWWNWYDQLVGSSVREVETGGFWGTSARIIMKHGFVLENDFIPSEGGVEMSLAQAQALETINTALKPGGVLARRSRRTPARVRQVLDQAFGSNMAQSELVARSANATIIGKNLLGQDITLAQALAGDANSKWNVVSFEGLTGKETAITQEVQDSRTALLKRVRRALNDKHPVVMSLMIDFNALDVTDATFKKGQVDERGVGRQGGHMVVLEDYTVNNVPGFGHIGEGDLSADQKAAAVDGDVELLVAKNSWGKARADRGLTDGYTRFDAAYLFSQLAWKNGEEAADDDISYYTTLTDFVLPPGY